MENIDRLCAEYGYKFADEIKKALNSDAKKAESLITKALGVLQEQGLYAFTLFCESRGNTEKEGAEKMKEITTELLKDKLGLISNDDLLEEIRKENGLASRLDDLLLAIQVLEKSLIYARYHAKAFANSQEKGNNQNSKDSEEHQ
jgi:CRISPR/Cas system CMR-associated protein Cmr5 small subunit